MCRYIAQLENSIPIFTIKFPPYTLHEIYKNWEDIKRFRTSLNWNYNEISDFIIMIKKYN